MSVSEQLPQHPNLVLIITDQERATQHFPPGWEEENLPNLQRLKRHGMTFNRAFCNACMCSPSRSTLFSGLYVAQHQVSDTLTWGGLYSPTEPVLDPTLPNLAHMLRAGGYRVHYRGKWHMSKGATGESSLYGADVGIYGFEGWLPPDSGEDAKTINFGGGYANHDARYIEEAVAFLRRAEARQPFCLVLSLVNPHDVLSYPRTYTYGYTDADLEGPLDLPESWTEDLQANHKPTAQSQLLVSAAAGLGLLPTRENKRRYINFYGNLIRHIDREMGPVIDLLYDRDGNPTELGRSTIVVRTADHGEMGMAHGGLRQKAFNTYEESLRVPLVVSNPVLFPERRETDNLASLIDLMPTFADILNVEPVDGLMGRSLAPILESPENAPAVQEEIVFTFDDVRAGNPNASPVNAADRIRCIRETKWKYARYFHAKGSYPEEWEMYDLEHDPDELDNLGSPANPRYNHPLVRAERERLAQKLAAAEARIVKKHQNVTGGPEEGDHLAASHGEAG
jgi:choline-sulfatase